MRIPLGRASGAFCSEKFSILRKQDTHHFKFDENSANQIIGRTLWYTKINVKYWARLVRRISCSRLNSGHILNSCYELIRVILKLYSTWVHTRNTHILVFADPSTTQWSVLLHRVNKIFLAYCLIAGRERLTAPIFTTW